MTPGNLSNQDPDGGRVGQRPTGDGNLIDNMEAWRPGVKEPRRGLDESATPRFPFVFGLSYTQLAYAESTARLGWHVDDPLSSEVHVAVQVENVGARAGDEVVQVYVHMPSDTVTRPVKELKAYDVTVYLTARNLGLLSSDRRVGG